MGGKRVRHRARRRVLPVVVTAALAAGGLTWALSSLDGDVGTNDGAQDVAELSTASPAPSGPGSASASSPASQPPPPPSSATPGRRSGKVPEGPREVRLPSGTTVPVVAVTTRGDGVLDVPDDVRTAGWWRGGSRLGDPFGATLIAAHIDSEKQGLGPYVELLRVERNDRFVVRSAHLVQRFTVTSLRLVPRRSLAGATDLFAASGPRRLVMVTCAGPFDPDRGGYLNLAVVTARPESGPRRRDAA